jgi:hypothetical protein
MIITLLILIFVIINLILIIFIKLYYKGVNIYRFYRDIMIYCFTDIQTVGYRICQILLLFKKLYQLSLFNYTVEYTSNTTNVNKVLIMYYKYIIYYK